MKNYYKHFDQYSHLLPKNLETFTKQQALMTSVNIRPLSECPMKFTPTNLRLAVGGAPALFSAIAHIDSRHLVYLNDTRRRPIENGSAWHIEEDAEAPTSYKSSDFLLSQIVCALIKREGLEHIAKTGFFY